MKLIIQIPVPQRGRRRCRRRSPICRQSVPGVDIIETLVVDDGSRDDTVGGGARARRAPRRAIPPAQGPGGRVHGRHRRQPASGRRHHRQHGRRQSVRRRDIAKLVAPLLSGEADIVIGDRNIRDIAHMSLAEEAAAAARQLGRAPGVEHRSARTRRAASAPTRARRRCA